jgi:hypothetical protein
MNVNLFLNNIILNIDPFVQNSKKHVIHNIDNHSIKYYGCFLTTKRQTQLNSLLKPHNVKCVTQYRSIRIVNI